MVIWTKEEDVFFIKGSAHAWRCKMTYFNKSTEVTQCTGFMSFSPSHFCLVHFGSFGNPCLLGFIITISTTVFVVMKSVKLFPSFNSKLFMTNLTDKLADCDWTRSCPFFPQSKTLRLPSTSQRTKFGGVSPSPFDNKAFSANYTNFLNWLMVSFHNILLHLLYYNPQKFFGN